MTLSLKFYFSFFLFGFPANAENILLEITNGAILGKVGLTARENQTMYMFKGIPYAEPPERFEWAEEKRPWDGLINCTYDKPQCVQGLTTVTGSEDCLTLSVYSPNLKANNSVLVWTHGGYFTQGNGSYNSAPPDFFVEEGVVFVLIQYRLGIFGFMSTEDMNCPGNWGFKDQVLAFRWVQENIKYFGGDPNRVTIGGQSAGAVATSLHLLSPKSEGLFQGMILNSGTALNLWSLDRKARLNAFETGLSLGIITLDSKKLVEGLKQKDYVALQKAALTVSTANTLTNPLAGIFNGYVSEPEHERAFFTGNCEERLSQGNFTKVPLMLGLNSLEAIAFGTVTVAIRSYMLSYDFVTSRLTPADLTSSLIKKNIAGLAIRNHFFKFGVVTSDDEHIYYFISSDQFDRPIWRFGLDVSNHCDTYFYQFSYEGPLSGITSRKIEGVGHAEELKFLFNFESNSTLPTDLTVRNRLVRLWTNFCKYWNPTPKTDPLLLNKEWKQMRSTDIDGSYYYFNIDSSLELLTDLKENDLKFYDDLYGTWGDKKYDTY